MSIESDLKKDGITVIESLDKSSIYTISKNISNKIVSAFPNFGYTFESLYNRFSNLPMYIATVPNGMSEASYFYKNSAIYFRDGMGLSDLEKFATHELIHNLQEIKDTKGHLLRLGLCTFKGSRASGMALNEAAVQLLSSNILGNTFETVTYYDITFSTISPNCYPLICNLIYQMAYITGEEVLFDSTFNSNDHFKNKFVALCGSSAYSQISNLFDKILDTEEKIIILENKLQCKDLSDAKLHSTYKKIGDLKLKLKNYYFETQELIIESYFTTTSKTLISDTDIDTFRKKLYNFKELIGSDSNYSFFNNYYINMMESLDVKYDSADGSLSTSTYLVPKKVGNLERLFNFIKKLFGNRETESN